MFRIIHIANIVLLLCSHCHCQDAIVIGAGISGIATARTLVDHGGFNVIVLEANPDRYGGRMWTNRDITSDGSGDMKQNPSKRKLSLSNLPD